MTKEHLAKLAQALSDRWNGATLYGPQVADFVADVFDTLVTVNDSRDGLVQKLQQDKEDILDALIRKHESSDEK